MLFLSPTHVRRVPEVGGSKSSSKEGHKDGRHKEKMPVTRNATGSKKQNKRKNGNALPAVLLFGAS